MGILREGHSHILEQYGFTKKAEGVYENSYRCSDLYYLWVTVNFNEGNLNKYVEYECGGEVSNTDWKLPKFIDLDGEELIDWLDEEVTETVNRWKGGD